MIQQDDKSTEVNSEHLDSALLNLKLVGGKIHPEELQAKVKIINHSRLDEDTDVIMEEKLMGDLLINSASDKKYGDLNRYLINSTIQGHNCYPYSKAAAYTML